VWRQDDLVRCPAYCEAWFATGDCSSGDHWNNMLLDLHFSLKIVVNVDLSRVSTRPDRDAMTIALVLYSAEELHAINKPAKALGHRKRYDDRWAIRLSNNYARRVGRVRIPAQIDAVRAIAVITYCANRRAARLSCNLERISTAWSK